MSETITAGAASNEALADAASNEALADAAAAAGATTPAAPAAPQAPPTSAAPPSPARPVPQEGERGFKRGAFRVLGRFLAPYKGLMAATLAALAFDMVGMLYVPTELSAMINSAVSMADPSVLYAHAAAMLAAALAGSAGAVATSWLAARLSAKVGRDIRVAVYEASLAFSGFDFERFGTGSMITRTLSDVNFVQESLLMGITMILPVPVMSVVAVVLAFSIDSVMGWVLLAVTLAVLAVTVAAAWRSAPIFTRLQDFIDRMNVRLRESITGARVIRAFGKEERSRERLDEVFSEYAQNAIRVNLLFSVADSLAFFLMNGVESLVMWLGADRVGAQAMQIGSISALIEYAVLIMFFMMMAQFALLGVPRALACLARADEVLSLVPSIQDAPAAVCAGSGRSAGEVVAAGVGGERALCASRGPNAEDDNLAPSGGLTPSDTGAAGNPQGSRAPSSSGAPAGLAPSGTPSEVARFSQVSFRFGDADEDTLHDLDFALRRSETCAIIGNTGSGKSTVAKLILRFHDVTAGTLSFCGRDVRELSQASLRARIAYVPQKAWLFSGTIASNLRDGREEATDDELWHALDVAQAGFVHELADGLGARVAQGGTNFSGGQRQRLAIARALVRKADLYIFDDSFSALDFKTDAALRHAIGRELAGAAVLIIAQRVSTIRDAAQIVVLKDGRVVGLGRHDELMETCPTYREIADSQARKGERHVER